MYQPVTIKVMMKISGEESDTIELDSNPGSEEEDNTVIMEEIITDLDDLFF